MSSVDDNSQAISTRVAIRRVSAHVLSSLTASVTAISYPYLGVESCFMSLPKHSVTTLTSLSLEQTCCADDWTQLKLHASDRHCVPCVESNNVHVVSLDFSTCCEETCYGQCFAAFSLGLRILTRIKRSLAKYRSPTLVIITLFKLCALDLASWE